MLKIINKKNIKPLIKDDEVLLIAGPCSIIDFERTLIIAKFLKNLGVNFLRAGAYKPRTSPYDYQGLGEEGLKILSQVKKETGMKIVSEILDPSDLPLFGDVDIIQVGARNMQNFALLKALGKTNKPVLLKRGFGNTVEEWLSAAEYIAYSGNQKIILCERGIRTFESDSRFTLDLAGIVKAKEMANLSVIADPSHAAGVNSLVTPLGLSSIVSGAEGLIIEVDSDPKTALSDQKETLSFEEFREFYEKLKKLLSILNKKLITELN